MILPKKRADGEIVYEVRVGNGPKRTFARKKDAVEYETEQRRSRTRERAGMEPEKGPLLFEKLADLWIQNNSPSAWRKSMLGYSVARWKGVYVRSLQSEQIGAWLHELPYAPKTKTHILQTLRQVLNAGVEWGYLGRNPARPGAFKAPGSTRLSPIQPLESWAEVERVSAAGSESFGRVVRFVCSTGLRFPSEVGRMRWRHVDRTFSVLEVQGTKTAAAVRTIPLSSNALAVLDELPRPLNRDTLVFGEWDRSNFSKAWREALSDCGLEHRAPYQMRHTCATLALEAGAPLDDVAELLGHTDIGITRRYYRKWTKPMVDRLRGVLDTIGGETDADVHNHAGA